MLCVSAHISIDFRHPRLAPFAAHGTSPRALPQPPGVGYRNLFDITTPRYQDSSAALKMGAQTVLLQHQPVWGDSKFTTTCTLRYVPVSHEWPAQVTGELAWGPSSFRSVEDYTLTLNDAEVSEVKSALRHFNGRAPDVLLLAVEALTVRTRPRVVWE